MVATPAFAGVFPELRVTRDTLGARSDRKPADRPWPVDEHPAVDNSRTGVRLGKRHAEVTNRLLSVAGQARGRGRRRPRHATPHASPHPPRGPARWSAHRVPTTPGH